MLTLIRHKFCNRKGLFDHSTRLVHSFRRYRPRRHARDDLARTNRSRYHGPRSDDTPVAELYIFQDHRLRANPASTADYNGTPVHWQFSRAKAIGGLMIAVRDVHVGPYHVEVADFHRSTGVDHQVSIEIVRIANPDTNTVVI